MPKYSTGSSSGGEASSCELCGAEDGSLTTTVIAGATLEVCQSCSSHGSSTSSGGDSEPDSRDREIDRKKRAAQNVARANPVWDGDSEHWEREGTNYDSDPLPYLVTDYGERLKLARQEEGLQREELAVELGLQESDVIAIEQGRATQAGIGGTVIEALEARFDIELAE